ncbi:TfuA-like protein [Streptacidiphilus carbonis]|uniref:TfuA-like protein n=1 Tax=Streptacidiphilus carbonis TaxID=105422 RepID=UPI0006944E1E|nr:TfuA-like protein [Streptacidiphilus carbonis]
MRTRTLIFGGPSLYGMDLSRWPELERHGPVKHGDLFRAALTRGDTVLIVDGVYQHYAPIRYKEIIAVLRKGVRVYGAASMGALRAAELAPLGVTGVGQVYEWYAGGELESDGDVALAHARAEADHRPLTLPIVSLLHAARALGSLTEPRVQRLVEHARTVPFSLRSARALLASLPEGTDLHEDTRAVCAYLSDSPEHDVKRQDVRALLDRITAARPGDSEPPATTLPASAWEQQWTLEETPPAAGGCTAGELLRFCQLFLPDWRERHRSWVRAQVQACAPDRPVAEIVRERGIWPEGQDDRAELAKALDIEEQPADEQLLSALVRTFRCGPGKFVYNSFPSCGFEPQEIEELRSFTEQALAANRLAEERYAHFSHAQLAAQEVVDVFAALWGEPWSDWCFIDRGFTSEEDFLRSARPFFVSARSIVAGQAKEVAP